MNAVSYICSFFQNVDRAYFIFTLRLTHVNLYPVSSMNLKQDNKLYLRSLVLNIDLLKKVYAKIKYNCPREHKQNKQKNTHKKFVVVYKHCQLNIE